MLNGKAHFYVTGTIPLDVIATKIGMTKEAVRKKLVFWVNNQVLYEVKIGVFQLSEFSSTSGKSG